MHPPPPPPWGSRASPRAPGLISTVLPRPVGPDPLAVVGPSPSSTLSLPPPSSSAALSDAMRGLAAFCLWSDFFMRSSAVQFASREAQTVGARLVASAQVVARGGGRAPGGADALRYADSVREAEVAAGRLLFAVRSFEAHMGVDEADGQAGEPDDGADAAAASGVAAAPGPETPRTTAAAAAAADVAPPPHQAFFARVPAAIMARINSIVTVSVWRGESGRASVCVCLRRPSHTSRPSTVPSPLPSPSFPVLSPSASASRRSWCTGASSS
jgi:hypothetical protein